jgi:hypothetical protein
MIYELREYVAHDHATQRVHDRFEKATLPLFARHGLNPIGFWVDADDPRRILYLLRFTDAEEQSKAWAGFQQDPAWQETKQESEADGPIVAEMTSRTLLEVPYWPTAETGATQ